MAIRMVRESSEMDRGNHWLWHGSSGRGEESLGIRGAVRLTAKILDWFATATCIAALAILAVYAADRKPPFKVLSMSHPMGAPGQEIVFHGQVWRDHSRECSATRTASAYHSDGLRTDYGTQTFSAAQIAYQESKTPGRMAPTFEVPENAVPGRPAYMMITLQYRCNQAHAWFKPIEVQNVFPFDVLPPN